MSCHSPIDAWRAREVNESGKRPLVFNPKEGFNDLALTIPCGKCLGCLLERSKNWAMRCMHEKSLHEENCFITLTYNDDSLPPNGVEKEVFQRFMKRLRYRYDGKRFKYFAVGEYGTDFGRPHYHSLLFGLDFPDKKYWAMRKGNKSFRSATLEDLWPFGNSEIGEANFQSAAYVARYLVKDYAKGLGQKGVREWRQAVGIAPEFCLMSRGGSVKGSHGIGYGWYENFQEELINFDSVIVGGKEFKPPRYYFDLLAHDYPEVAAKIGRRRRGRPDTPDKTPQQLRTEKKIAEAKQLIRQGGNL